MAETQKKTDEEILEGLEAAIASYAMSGGQRTISIGGVTFSYASLAELQSLHHFYQAKVDAAKPQRRAHVIRGVML